MSANTGSSTNANQENGFWSKGKFRKMIRNKKTGTWEESFITKKTFMFPPITEQHQKVISC
jgi:hypothetical protein